MAITPERGLRLVQYLFAEAGGVLLRNIEDIAFSIDADEEERAYIMSEVKLLGEALKGRALELKADLDTGDT